MVWYALHRLPIHFKNYVPSLYQTRLVSYSSLNDVRHNEVRTFASLTRHKTHSAKFPLCDVNNNTAVAGIGIHVVSFYRYRPQQNDTNLENIQQLLCSVIKATSDKSVNDMIFRDTQRVYNWKSLSWFRGSFCKQKTDKIWRDFFLRVFNY